MDRPASAWQVGGSVSHSARVIFAAGRGSDIDIVLFVDLRASQIEDPLAF